VQDVSSRPDQELVAAALSDRNAYALVVRRWQPPLSRYVRRLLGRHAEAADDVLQDIFIKVYVNLNAYDRRLSFGPWIYRIARNETVSHLRKLRAEPALVTGEDALLIIERLSDGRDVQEEGVRLRIYQDVLRSIHSLDTRYRDALVLRYLEEKGYDEIADILELPPGTVATLVSRGTKQLRAALVSLGLKTSS
jgi:RNA polymerase sigma-70 factor (ECF subfamily)